MEPRLSNEDNMENDNSKRSDEGLLDYEQESTETLLTPVRKTIDLSDVKPVRPDNNQFILALSSVLLYGGLFIYAGALVWVCLQPSIDLYASLLKVAWIPFLGSLAIIIDLIIVCNCYKGNGWLVFLALVLPLFYPMQRAKHVEREEGVGVLCTCVWAVAAVWLGVFSSKAFSSYGALIIEEDAKTRAETTILLEQIDENGYSCEEMIKDKIRLGDGEFESRGETEIFTLWGLGRVSIEHNFFVLLDDYQVETQLEFTKNDVGVYELEKVLIGSRELTDADAEAYWSEMIRKYKSFQ